MNEVTPQWMVEQGFSKTFVSRFWNKVKKTESCWVWTGAKCSSGYGNINKGYGFTGAFASHRASWMIHNGPIPEGLCVLHNCPIKDNRACVNPSHLWIGTKRDNILDALSKGTVVVPYGKGEQSPRSKLSQSQVNEIRSLWPKINQTELGKIYGVRSETIWYIVHHVNWK